jgi:hypothetical protein
LGDRLGIVPVTGLTGPAVGGGHWTKKRYAEAPGEATGGLVGDGRIESIRLIAPDHANGERIDPSGSTHDRNRR